jgi:hypothetical protein
MAFQSDSPSTRRKRVVLGSAGVFLTVGLVATVTAVQMRPADSASEPQPTAAISSAPRMTIDDDSGARLVWLSFFTPFAGDGQSLQQIRDAYQQAANRCLEEFGQSP